MNQPPNQSEIDEVLRKIGRNVLHFQRMESMLKFLISRSDLQGSASELKANHEKSVDTVSRQTMGNLVKSFISSVYSGQRPGKEPEVEIKKPYFSFSFKVDADPKHVAKRKAALEEVVNERNALIHQMLAKFDQTSSKSCSEISGLLDAQAERLRPECENRGQTPITLFIKSSL